MVFQAMKVDEEINQGNGDAWRSPTFREVKELRKNQLIRNSKKENQENML